TAEPSRHGALSGPRPGWHGDGRPGRCRHRSRLLPGLDALGFRGRSRSGVVDRPGAFVHPGPAAERPRPPSATGRTAVIRRLVLLLGGTAAFWLLVAYPARILGGPQAVVYSVTAMLVCLVPATLTLILAQGMAASPSRLLFLVLGGTGLR